MIKLVALDLDGTLLRDDKSISERTKAALARCREKGVKIIYATGRGGSAKDRAPAELFDGRITMNGAVGYAGEELVYSRFAQIDLARELLLACDRRGLRTAAERNDMHYANFDVAAEWPGTSSPYQPADFRSLEGSAEKLYAIVRDGSDAAFIRAHLPPGLHMTVSRDNLAQVMHVEATKARAVAALAAHWGIGTEETVAFGDDLNDLDMLVHCGVGVAMGNALDEVKAAAGEVCGANNDDGVAEWLERHLLSQNADIAQRRPR